MQLANLDNCIQDALKTRQQIAAQIAELLGCQNQDAKEEATKISESLTNTGMSVNAVQKQLAANRQRIEALRANLEQRRRAIKIGVRAHEGRQQKLRHQHSSLISHRPMIQQATKEKNGQLRRLGEELAKLYPIEPSSAGSLLFMIRDLAMSGHGDEALRAAALGHAAHLVALTSRYLGVHLPYPVTPRSSTSSIYDPIASTLPTSTARTFPLHQRGSLEYRFEYGVFLLNTDIDCMMSKVGAQAADIRLTAGNLKYLLAMMTDGRGSLPGRKRGRLKAADTDLAEDEDASN